MHQNYLVKYEANYADEFEVYGLAILTENDKQYFDNLDNFPVIQNIGTNKDIQYGNKKQLLSKYSWTVITDEQAEWISRLIGYDYGHFFYPEEDIDYDDYDPDVEKV